MAKSLPPYDQLVVEEDYIDMDISSATFFCYPKASPPHHHAREFEFRMGSNPVEREPIPSPADELFYKGKLLPLHLPPRLQMVQKLLQNSPTRGSDRFDGRFFATAANTATNTAATTPFASCNVSPAASCHVSGELDPEDYFPECAAALVEHHHPKNSKSWSRKLRFMKQSNLGLKLKASKAYLRSLFVRPRCADDKFPVAKAKEETGKRKPFGELLAREGSVVAAAAAAAAKSSAEEGSGHRRSFSGAIKWRSSAAKSSSSASSSCSSSSNSSSFSIASSSGQPTLKRSSSVNSDMENSIQGAIAYCKRSQQLLSPKKSVSDVGYSSLTVSRIAAEKTVRNRRGQGSAEDDGNEVDMCSCS